MGGRQILDAVMTANEVVDDLISGKKEEILCKLDMEKAYDHVSWDFVEYMLKRMGFGQKWLKWIHTCIASTSFGVLFNDRLSSFFSASRRLRQGDLLSSLLFILVIEALSGLLARATDLQLLRAVSMGRGDSAVQVSHFFSADDTLIFCLPEVRNLLHLRCVLFCFQTISRPNINLSKSEMVTTGDTGWDLSY